MISVTVKLSFNVLMMGYLGGLSGNPLQLGVLQVAQEARIEFWAPLSF